MRKVSLKSTAARVASACCAIACTITLASCGQTDSAQPQANQLTGISATGKLGEKPTVKLAKTPMTVENGSYAVLQKGDGAPLEEGARLCSQGIAIDAKSGSEMMNTWKNNQMDCSIVLSSDKTKMNPDYYKVLKDQRINSTVAFGVNDENSNGTSYIMVFTFLKQMKDLTQATGTQVKDIPANLPKVTTAKDGKPSIDMNGYKGSDKLVVQPLIKGKGEAIGADDTAVVKYTGWLLNGKQFDSSWDKNTTFDASMNGGVIKGWIDGLKGQTVGSQVLLVVPPELGYGDQAAGDIPANSTLVFVVDILGKY